ncbi:MAG: GNAT family N-acetyltransferase [Sedimenticola sp.]
MKAQQGGSARTYVVCSETGHVVGYYALATGSIDRDDAPGKVKKNMSHPIPVILLGRLAVDHDFKGQGIGADLLMDALLRVVNAAEQIGVRAVLVHALDEAARNFYLKHGFYESPTNDMTLMVTVAEIDRTLR